MLFFITQALLALLACVFFFLLQGYRVLGLCCLGLMGAAVEGVTAGASVGAAVGALVVALVGDSTITRLDAI